MVSVKLLLAIRLVNGYWQKKKIVYLWNTSVYSFLLLAFVYLLAIVLAWQFFSSWQFVLVLAMRFCSTFHMVE
jgi:hypothetical protein